MCLSPAITVKMKPLMTTNEQGDAGVAFVHQRDQGLPEHQVTQLGVKVVE